MHVSGLETSHEPVSGSVDGGLDDRRVDDGEHIVLRFRSSFASSAGCDVALRSRIMQPRVILCVVLCAILTACGGGGVSAQNVPPTGQIWFGRSFDPQTFVLTGQRSSVGTQEPVALVAHLTKPVDGNVTIRASLDGTLVATAPVAVTGSGQVFGYVLGALVTPGQWRYDIVDIGGNILATGNVTAQ